VLRLELSVVLGSPGVVSDASWWIAFEVKLNCSVGKLLMVGSCNRLESIVLVAFESVNKLM
jgi:hypothetical protein